MDHSVRTSFPPYLSNDYFSPVEGGHNCRQEALAPFSNNGLTHTDLRGRDVEMVLNQKLVTDFNRCSSKLVLGEIDAEFSHLLSRLVKADLLTIATVPQWLAFLDKVTKETGVRFYSELIDALTVLSYKTQKDDNFFKIIKLVAALESQMQKGTYQDALVNACLAIYQGKDYCFHNLSRSNRLQIVKQLMDCKQFSADRNGKLGLIFVLTNFVLHGPFEKYILSVEATDTVVQMLTKIALASADLVGLQWVCVKSLTVLCQNTYDPGYDEILATFSKTYVALEDNSVGRSCILKHLLNTPGRARKVAMKYCSSGAISKHLVDKIILGSCFVDDRKRSYEEGLLKVERRLSIPDGSSEIMPREMLDSVFDSAMQMVVKGDFSRTLLFHFNYLIQHGGLQAIPASLWLSLVEDVCYHKNYQDLAIKQYMAAKRGDNLDEVDLELSLSHILLKVMEDYKDSRTNDFYAQAFVLLNRLKHMAIYKRNPASAIQHVLDVNNSGISAMNKSVFARALADWPHGQLEGKMHIASLLVGDGRRSDALDQRLAQLTQAKRICFDVWTPVSFISGVACDADTPFELSFRCVEVLAELKAHDNATLLKRLEQLVKQAKRPVDQKSIFILLEKIKMSREAVDGLYEAMAKFWTISAEAHRDVLSSLFDVAGRLASKQTSAELAYKLSVALCGVVLGKSNHGEFSTFKKNLYFLSRNFSTIEIKEGFDQKSFDDNLAAVKTKVSLGFENYIKDVVAYEEIIRSGDSTFQVKQAACEKIIQFAAEWSRYEPSASVALFAYTVANCYLFKWVIEGHYAEIEPMIITVGHAIEGLLQKPKTYSFIDEKLYGCFRMIEAGRIEENADEVMKSLNVIVRAKELPGSASDMLMSLYEVLLDKGYVNHPVYGERMDPLIGALLDKATSKSVAEINELHINEIFGSCFELIQAGSLSNHIEQLIEWLSMLNDKIQLASKDHARKIIDLTRKAELPDNFDFVRRRKLENLKNRLLDKPVQTKHKINELP